MTKKANEIRLLNKLRPFVETVSKVKIDHRRIFGLCVRASFTKSFEFVDRAFRNPDEDCAFFGAAGLRSICEDIIYLSYAARISPSDRELFIKCKIFDDCQQGIHAQAEFFRAFGIVQPILSTGATTTEIRKVKNELSGVWKSNGFPNMRRGRSPTTRAIAEAVEPGMLAVVYEYIYRLTSKMVHFSPQHLLRTGWGSTCTTTFSTRNMGPYFVAISQIYGLFLFCLYFERFARFLRPGASNQTLVAALRKELVICGRWPEMITFEEMNLEVPDMDPISILARIIRADEVERGFLEASRN